MTHRVVAVEDDRRYRESLHTLFRHTADFDLTATFGSGEAALEHLRATEGGGPDSWDLVLMDLELPGMSGIEATERIRRSLPAVSVVVLTVFEDPSNVLRAICAGADGYLTKGQPPDELIAELRSVMEGGSPLSPAVARTVLQLLRRLGPEPGAGPGPGDPALDLTDREREVLGCLVDGRSYKRTATELGISKNTVRSHVRSIYDKLQVRNVAQAVSRALREGLV
ncbi:MAG: response regulator [Gammaproteobacteria bacterium]|nr:response regulator transcription factor [Gemmatimonadota bacterium]NIR41096.1 response regulator transcription factor [Actinomycetota bacterium]NIU74168.1 response regulator [Gammaproteobacteria bacterium]NIY08430.1 response regulator [Gemmatimonadota bacterium]